jgi:hypothetical protein
MHGDIKNKFYFLIMFKSFNDLFGRREIEKREKKARISMHELRLTLV